MGREGVRRGSKPGFSFIYTASLPSNLLPDIPRKKPFSVEVNGPAQINGSVWVSPQRTTGRSLLAPPCLQPHTGRLYTAPSPLLPRLSMSTKPRNLSSRPLRTLPNAEVTHLLRTQGSTRKLQHPHVHLSLNNGWLGSLMGNAQHRFLHNRYLNCTHIPQSSNQG